MGVFTVHNEPTIARTSRNIHTTTIDYDVRKEIKKALNRLGVNQAALFPDVDGIASHITWLKTNAF